MSSSIADALRRQLDGREPTVVVRVGEALGSTPREEDAAMVVTATEVAGTIGGGRLEWTAIARARAMLREGSQSECMDIPLGPAVGQCCGGRVRLELMQADAAALAAIEMREREEQADWPQLFVFGAGHVGTALARALNPLPVIVTVIETRESYLAGLPDRMRALASADPAAEVRTAPEHAAYVVTTHSHQLDYEITEAALARGDAAYVGMIGSATKRARFGRWFVARGGEAARLATLVCPIGGQGVRDKRPAVIAAFVVAEVLAKVLGVARGAAQDSFPPAQEIADGPNGKRHSHDRASA